MSLLPRARPCAARPTNGNLVSDGLRSFEYDAENRLAQVNITKDFEAAKITYLHNSLGQRVFKSEPQTAQTLPDEQTLGTGFVDWLRRNFQWLWAQAQTNATLGTSYSYGDASIPSWAITGEYGNGGASSTGRTEYIWLPTDDGSAIPVAMFRNNRYFNIHSDHLGTPRLVTDDTAKPVWQWAYSAFGDNKPTGILRATTNPNAAITNQPTLLQATGPATTLNLRFPGQYADSETGLFYNYYRSYQPNQGRYTQNDPIGLDGGWNRFGYVGGKPLGYIDPFGLDEFSIVYNHGAGTVWVTPPGSTSAQGFPAGNNTTSSSRGAWSPGTYRFDYSTRHPDAAPGSSFGSNGNAVFRVPGCVGCGVHSGREGVSDRRGGSGVQHVTEGCIRTTDDATRLIQDLIRGGHTPVLEVTR